MVKSKLINLNFVNKKIKGKKVRLLRYLLIFLFFAGLVIGSVSIKSDNEIISLLTERYVYFLKHKDDFSLTAIFLYSLLVLNLPVFFSFFIGVSAVGIPFSAVIPFIAGFLSGIFVGYTYETYLLKGLGFCAINIFPAAVITVSALIFATEDSINMSRSVLLLCTESRIKNDFNIKKYCLKFLIYVFICAIASLITVVMKYLFDDLFIFI